MNKFTYTLLCLLLCAGASRAQRTLCLQTKVETKGVGKTIPARGIENTPNGVRVTYHFNNIVLLDDPLYAGATIVKMDGFWPNYSVGEPAFLSRWDTFVVPNTDVKVVISDSSYVEFPMELSPARPLQSNSGNDFYTKENVIPIESYRGFFPSSFISATRNDSYRGQQLLDVCVTPVQYDYANKKVRIFTMIQYNLQYNVTSLEKSLARFSKERIKGNTFLDNIALNIPFQKKVQSPKTIASSLENVSNKYLIISVPKYEAAVNKFAEWKKTLGFDVHVEMRSYWDTTMVKNAVINACNPDTIGYLLIVGGNDDVPSLIRSRSVDNKTYTYPTDLNYGCMDDGYTPDIFRGRLLVNTGDEAMTVVDKIINYEKNPVDDEFFYKRGVHCSYFQDWNYYILFGLILLWPIDGIEDRRFVLTSERIRESMLRDSLCLVDSITRVYYTDSIVNPVHWNNGTYANGEEIPIELQRSRFDWDGDSTAITNCINQKAFYVLMRDHGNVDKWEEPTYTNNNINKLNNGNYLPVVFSICCLTGKFDENNCFCESFLKKENGGCVAIFGATQVSLSGPNDVMAEGMFDAIWPSLNLRPVFGNISISSYSPTLTPTYRLGQILDQGLRRCNEAYLNVQDTLKVLYTSEIFHCFGDPSMMIYTEKPQKFAEPLIYSRGDSIFVFTEDGDCDITFYNKATEEVKSYKGNYAAYANPSDSLVICLNRHNYVPYIWDYTKDIYIQNEDIQGETRVYTGNTIYVGNNVTSTKPTGDVNIQNSHVTIQGKRLELHPGTRISVGTTLETRNRQ